MSKSTPKNRQHKQVEVQLTEVFGGVLSPQVISSVAQNCGYNLNKACICLSDLTSNLDSTSKSKNHKKDSPTKHQRPKTLSDTLKQTPGCKKVTVSPQKHPHQAPRQSKKDQEIARVIQLIRKGFKTVIFLRGLPGSGKSTLARWIVDSTVSPAHRRDYKQYIYSADDYFARNGMYMYNPLQITDAHQWSQRRAYDAMRSGVSPVIIDNTNIQMWQLRPYAMMAMEFTYIIEVLEPSTPWAFNDNELARRTIHGVPQMKLKEMLASYEKNITPEKIMGAFSLAYRNSRPPILRKYPPVVDNGFYTIGNQVYKVPNAPTNSVAYSSTRNRNCEPQNLMNFDNNSVTNMSSSHKENKAKSSVIDDLFTCQQEVGTEALKPDVLSWSFAEGTEWGTKIESDDSSSNSEVMSPKASSSFSDDTEGHSSTIGARESASVSLFDESCGSATSGSSKSNTASKLYPNLDLASWGINHQTLQSWDIYTPLQNPVLNNSANDTTHSVISKPEFKDSGTNTSSNDFSLLNSTELDPHIKVLSGRVRDISIGLSNLCFTPKQKATLDKSCETDEDFLIDNITDTSKDMEQLVSVFPDIPFDYLKEIYDKCNADVIWTGDVLCEDNKAALTTLNVQKDIEETDCCEDMKKELSDGIYDIKKKLEDKLGFCGEKLVKFTNSVFGIQEAKEPQTSAAKFETCSTPMGDVLLVDSDVEMDEIEFEGTEAEQMIEINLGETLVTELENKLKEPSFIYPKGFQPVVQMPVALAKQLYAFYIESVYQQLDAQEEILQKLVKEDEEFAKKLQEQEDNNENPPQAAAVSLTEIMDEQLALNIKQRDMNKWKNLTPDDLAAKLTKKKLFETFPTIEPDVLVELWQAHENNYQATVESVVASNPELMNGLKETAIHPPLSSEVMDEMKEAHASSEKLSQTTDAARNAVSYRDEASVYLGKRTTLYQKAQDAHRRGLMEVAIFYSELARKQTQLYEHANEMAASAFLNEHSNRLQSYDTLDLHYLYVKEAVSALDIFLDNNIHLLKGTSKSQALFVITGRGKRSINQISKLKPAVITRLKKRKLRYVELNPGLLKVKVNENSVITSNMS